MGHANGEGELFVHPCPPWLCHHVILICKVKSLIVWHAFNCMYTCCVHTDITLHNITYYSYHWRSISCSTATSTGPEHTHQTQCNTKYPIFHPPGLALEVIGNNIDNREVSGVHCSLNWLWPTLSSISNTFLKCNRYVLARMFWNMYNLCMQCF